MAMWNASDFTHLVPDYIPEGVDHPALSGRANGPFLDYVPDPHAPKDPVVLDEDPAWTKRKAAARAKK